MKNVLRMLPGVLAVLAAVWGGSYLAHIFPFGHWAHGPLVLSAVFLFAGGCIQAAWAFTKGME